MNVTRHIAVRRAVVATLSATCLTASGNAALAQTAIQSDAPVPTASMPAGDLFFEPAFNAGQECGSLGAGISTAAIGPGCPWANTSLGLNIGRRIALPEGEITVKIGFARSNDAALSLDRQLRQSSPARIAENTLMALGSEARLFDGRLRLTSDLGWSQSWESDIAPSPQWRGRYARESGFSQRHGFEWTVIERPRLRWKIDGSIARASEDYRTGSIYGVGGLLMGDGDMDRLATRLDIGRWKLRASLADMRTIASQNATRKASLGFGGVTLAFTGREGRTLPLRQFSVTPTRTNGTSLALEFDLFSLAPTLAMQDKGLAVLLPRQLSVTRSHRELSRPTSRSRPLTHRSALGLFGMWTTPLGDTLVDFERDRLSDPAGNRLETASQLLVTHSVRIGGWSVNVDLLSLRTRATGGDDDATLYYSAGIARTFANGARLKFELGRDTQSFGGADSEFTLRDKSHRAKLELDLSTPLQKRLANPSVRLTIGTQIRLNRSRYQLRFLDEVVDENSEGYARQGLLASFGYRF
ncbi:hypothetical protein [Novosphingobium sp. TH158]|uniref:hypothetical protein n=1 Tax=Novosphingobium sp. TH158 TaxID=2067455 RepID=UPI000C7C54C8|nr:hypothetical protein [Novosphingobium sp. TH158]PLK26429.1 hypothetical protein C0V78_05690 [Novosphingobium sp. TH158]